MHYISDQFKCMKYKFKKNYSKSVLDHTLDMITLINWINFIRNSIYKVTNMFIFATNLWNNYVWLCAANLIKSKNVLIAFNQNRVFFSAVYLWSLQLWKNLTFSYLFDFSNKTISLYTIIYEIVTFVYVRSQYDEL